ncbi:PAS domain S-box protein, partial [Vibrio cholerae]|uniref:PAS domain S-box protein n=1 Tax=Vibrio cholerae TaxID=666 RepID=UPI003B52807F
MSQLLSEFINFITETETGYRPDDFSLKEGIISIDNKGILRSINKSACEILGLRREQALNRRLTTILP